MFICRCNASAAAARWARSINDCVTERVLGLRRTSGLSAIFLLLTNVTQQGQGPLAVNRLTQAGVSVERQPAVPSRMINFGDARSKLTKPAFLMWVVNHPKFQFVWYMEDDTFFTGNWASLLADARWGNADIVARRVSFPNNSGWARYFAGPRCKVHGMTCLKRTDTTVDYVRQVWWPLLRLSNMLATVLFKSLNQGSASGHHEILTDQVCRTQAGEWCEYKGFEDKDLGKYELAGWGNYTCQTAAKCLMPSLASLKKRFAQSENRLYHPIKCVYEQANDKKWQQVLRLNQLKAATGRLHRF